MGSPIKYYRVPEVSRACCVNVVDSMIKEEVYCVIHRFCYSNFLRIRYESSSNKTRKNDGNCFN